MALLGRNGAGKTTTMRTLMGLVPAASGQVAFRGEDVTSLPAYERARRGIGYVPQDRRMFRGLTVEENLDVAESAARNGQGHGSRVWDREAVYGLFPVLAERRRQAAGSLSGGEQRMLAIARALVTNPQLILLDEPTDGLAPVIVEQLFELIRRIAAGGLAILLAEQNVGFAAGLATRAYVIDKGAIHREGTLSALLADEELVGRHLSV